eukprot:gene20953-biopygen15459
MSTDSTVSVPTGASASSSQANQPQNLPSPPQAIVSAASIKIPPFWPNDPTVWFAQIEAQFFTRNISTQATKFAYVVGALQPEIAQEIRDILITPPTHNPYDRLKEELIKRTSVSEEKRLHQLLQSEELGDRKPSQLLRHMHQLLGDNRLDERILKQLFLQRLPSNAQLILASTADDVTLTQLASLADKILAVALPPQPISAIQPPETLQQPSNSVDIKNLQLQINQLTTQIALTDIFNSSLAPAVPTVRVHRSQDNNSRARQTVVLKIPVDPSVDLHLPILGADFLAHFGLKVDIAHRLLIDRTTNLHINGIQATDSSPHPIYALPDASSPYITLLEKFPELARQNYQDTAIKHDVTHHIDTTGPPAFCRPRRLAPDRLKIARDELSICSNLA